MKLMDLFEKLTKDWAWDSQVSHQEFYIVTPSKKKFGPYKSKEQAKKILDARMDIPVGSTVEPGSEI